MVVALAPDGKRRFSAQQPDDFRHAPDMIGYARFRRWDYARGQVNAPTGS